MSEISLRLEAQSNGVLIVNEGPGFVDLGPIGLGPGTEYLLRTTGAPKGAHFSMGYVLGASGTLLVVCIVAAFGL